MGDRMEKIISLAKRRGFVFQGSEIYGGLAGTWDYGPYGVALKNNIKDLWWKTFVADRDDMYGVDTTLLMNARVFEASGHTGAGFADPLVEDVETRKRYRADHLLEDKGIDPEGMSLEEITAAIKKHNVKSPDGNPLSDARQFNLMFQTEVGALGGDIAYLRPETAQGMFVNFKNVLDSLHPKLPFGMAQVGKAFRNEIAPRDFIFRTREFEQMEIEYFVRAEEWQTHFDAWTDAMRVWMEAIGLDRNKIHELDVPEADRAHYSQKTIDFEYDFPFGRKELYGLAYRTDFDLKNHTEHSGVDMRYYDDEQDERFIPHVIEPTFGLDRTVLAALSEGYAEEGEGKNARAVLKLPPAIAPVKAAVFPLLKNKPELVAKAREVFTMLRREIPAVAWDDNGNIGKRYRRQDEIGTPFCVTVDFESLNDDTVTLRTRDSMAQDRLPIADLSAALLSRLDKSPS